jgi:hypothetical protein
MGYIVSNSKMIVNDELKGVWCGMNRTWPVSRYFPVYTEATHEESVTVACLWIEFEHGTSRIQSRIANHWTLMFVTIYRQIYFQIYKRLVSFIFTPFLFLYLSVVSFVPKSMQNGWNFNIDRSEKSLCLTAAWQSVSRNEDLCQICGGIIPGIVLTLEIFLFP